MGQGKAYGVEDADLVVLASPVGTFEKIVQEIAPHLKKGAVLTDVGSVKGKLVKADRAGTSRRRATMCPAIRSPAGRSPAWPKQRKTLFQGRRCILTPTPKTDKKALASVREVWTAAGAVVIEMDADLHDKVFGAVSHLPHVAAFAMMCAVAELNTGTEDYLAVFRGRLPGFHAHRGKLSGNVEGYLPHEQGESSSR